MNIEKTPDGKFAIVHGGQRLVLEKAQYEDIFYALPLDNGQFFRLINDTVITTDGPRKQFRAMVAEAGGAEKAMEELQASVTSVSP